MLKFFFFFKEEKEAKVASRILEQNGYARNEIFCLEASNELKWTLIVEKDMEIEDFFKKEEEIFEKLTNIAEECGGKYDGHEWEISAMKG